MDLKRLAASSRFRVLAANAYAVAITVVLVRWWLLHQPPVAAPLGCIAMGLPFVFGLVPRNWFYGWRMPSAMKTDVAWYAQNKIAGIALVMVGAIWLGVLAVR